MENFKDELKKSLTIEQVFDYVAELGGEPVMVGDHFTAKTICHGGESHKLYYYNNSTLFHCYTDCPEGSFDIYQLTQKVKSRELNQEWSLPKAISYVANYFGYIQNFDNLDSVVKLDDWNILDKYNNRKNDSYQQKVDLKIYDNSILNFLPTVNIPMWEKEGILPEIIQYNHIKYNPVNHSIVIPHYNINNDLIGIRERTLIKENEIYGKYKPAILNGKMYNHPLGFNLYNLNNSKEAIKNMKKVIVFEGEKSPLLFASYFGKENDISVACCGSSLISYQVKLLLSLGINEIIIAFDKQFQKIGDEEFKKWTKKLEDIDRKYSSFVNISFMFDKWDLLNYKDSPIDEGKDKFLELFERRIYL